MAFPFSDEYPNAKPYYLGDVGPLYADPTEDYLDENEIPMTSYGTEKALISREVPVVAQTVMVTRATNPSSYQQGEVPTIEELADRILLSQQVSDIDNPTEISSVTGDNQGTLLLAYEAVSGGINKATIYEWDIDVGSGGSSPQVVASTGGSWVAIAGYAATSGSAGEHTLSSHATESGGYHALSNPLYMEDTQLVIRDVSGVTKCNLWYNSSVAGGELSLSGSGSTLISAGRDSYIVGYNLGIGLDAPAAPVHVYKSSGSPASIRLANGTDYNDITQDGASFGWKDSSGGWRVVDTGSRVGFGKTPDTDYHMYRSSSGGVHLRLENTSGYGDLVSDGGGLGFMVDGSNWSLFQHGSTKAVGVNTLPAGGTMLHVYEDSTAANKLRLENTEGYLDLVADAGDLGVYDGSYYLWRVSQAGATDNQPRFVVGGSSGDYHIQALGGSTVYPAIVASRYSGSEELGLFTGSSYHDVKSVGKNLRLRQEGSLGIFFMTNGVDRGRVEGSGVIRLRGSSSTYPAANESVNIGGRCEIGAGETLDRLYGSPALIPDDWSLVSFTSLGYWSVNGTTKVSFNAPLELTPGTVLKSVTFYMYDSSTTTLTTYDFRIWRSYVAAGGISTSTVAYSLGVDKTGLTTISGDYYKYTLAPTSDHVVGSTDMIHVNIDVTRDNGLCYLYGFSVQYGEVVY